MGTSTGSTTVAAPPEFVRRLLADVALWPWLLRAELDVDFVERTPSETVYRLGRGETADYALRSTTDSISLSTKDSGTDIDVVTLTIASDGPAVTELGWWVTVPLDGLDGFDGLDGPAVAERVGELYRECGRIPEGPLAAAGHLAPRLAERAESRGAVTTLPGDEVALLRSSDAFRMALPTALGGLDTDFPTIVRTVEELSRADAAAGWCVLIGNNSCYLAWLDEQDAVAAFGADGGLIAAGSTAVRGTGVPLPDGGYRVSGRWPFNSGCLHADWLMCGFTSGPGEARLAIMPADAVTVHGTWHVAGLEASGSHDVSVSEVDVPAERIAPLYSAPASFGGPMHRLSAYNMQALLMIGFPLGLARRAVDEALLALGASATTFAAEIALAETSLAAARSLVLETTGELWATLTDGGKPDTRQDAGIALTLRHANDTARRIVTSMVELACFGGARPSDALRRCQRDIQVATAHILVSDDVLTKNAVRALSS